MCPGKLFIQIYSVKQACHFQGGGTQSHSSLGITFLCWQRRLCCPWHSSSMFFSITLGVALAAALARCKALASFPAEACKVCVKSFLAETLNFAWLYFCFFKIHSSSYRSTLFWPTNKHEEFSCSGWVFGEKGAYLTHTHKALLVSASAPFLIQKQLLWHLMNLSSYILPCTYLE